MRIDHEIVQLRFPGDPTLYAPLADCAKSAKNGVDCFHTSFEEPYTVRPLRDFPADRQAFLPVLVDSGADRPKVLITEADLIDYPGLWLRASQDAPGLDGLFAPFPLEEKVIGSEYPQAVVVQRAGYIAETNGRRAYPWRVLAIADRDADLPANDIVYRLGGTTEPGDWTWLRPGKSQSEWLWDNILYDVPFEVGPEHRDLPPLHRLRRQVRDGVPVLRRGLVEGGRPALAHARARRAGPRARGPRQGPRRRALDIGPCCATATWTPCSISCRRGARRV